MAFVVDIRRQAVMQHLMFKAVFELSKDRADFISLLFSRARPANMTAETPIEDMWRAFALVAPDPGSTTRNEARVVSRLIETHKFALTAEEVSTLKSVVAGLPDGFAATGVLVVGSHVPDRFVQPHGIVFRSDS